MSKEEELQLRIMQAIGDALDDYDDENATYVVYCSICKRIPHPNPQLRQLGLEINHRIATVNSEYEPIHDETEE